MATILVIDDKQTNRDILRTVLGYKNHRVLEAEDGVDGLAMIRNRHPDLVIADILMPRMDGYQMVHSLRNDPAIAETRVIFYTATYLKSEALKLAEACGVSHLIIKPSEPQDILDTVEAVLGQNASARAEASETFDHDHLRLITDKLAQKVKELEGANHRLIEEAAQRKRAEAALLSSEARMRAVLDAAVDSIITLDADGKVIEVNPAAELAFGYRREQILGKCLNDFIAKPGGSEQQFAQQLIPTDQPAVLCRRLEVTAIGASGNRFPVEVTISPIGSTGPPMYTAFLRDLTDEKARNEMRRRTEALEKQNQAMQEANRLKSEFLANMSHELRTPLNAIIGFTQLIHDSRVGTISANQKEYLGDVLAGAKHLLQLINDILDLSKVEAGKMAFKPEPVELARIVQDVGAALQPLVTEKNLQLQINLDESVDEVFTDVKSLKQVLYNYLSNAIKFTDPDGRIDIRSRPEPLDHFRIEVEDSGIGIGSEDLSKLFHNFQQLDNTRQRKYPGTGLGLALTKRIVEAQGGHVGVRSTLGQGSLFFAVLPRAAGGRE